MRAIEDLGKPCQNCSGCAKKCANDKALDSLLAVPEEKTRSFDIIIVGAGAVGCSIARELSKRNVSVLVLEKAADVAQGASKANSGIVHGGYDEKHGTMKSRLARQGNKLFRGLNEELHFGFRETGSLVIAFKASQMPALESLMANGIKNGCKDLEIIFRDRIIELEPMVNPDVYAALYCPSAGITSPYEYVIALAENASENGVEILLEREVTDIQIAPNGTDRFIVRTNVPHDVFSCSTVINCAGLYSDRIAAMVGADDFQITPRKGEYVLLDKAQGKLAKTVLFPLPDAVRGKGILVSPTFHGNLLLGPTSRDPGDPVRSNKEILGDILISARASVPDFDVNAVITSYAGLRAKCSRKDFVIEENERVKGFINVAGIDSPGLTSSPAVAKLVVNDILGDKRGSFSHLDLSPNPAFNPFRPPIIQEKPVGFKGEIDHETPALNIICRCETVTEAEIIDAIHRISFAHGTNRNKPPFTLESTLTALYNPPTTPGDQEYSHILHIPSTDTVKKRTRAGMGRCQGNFCEPRVAAIIARECGVSEDMVPRRGHGSSILPHRRVTENDRRLLIAASQQDLYLKKQSKL